MCVFRRISFLFNHSCVFSIVLRTSVCVYEYFLLIGVCVIKICVGRAAFCIYFSVTICGYRLLRHFFPLTTFSRLIVTSRIHALGEIEGNLKKWPKKSADNNNESEKFLQMDKIGVRYWICIILLKTGGEVPPQL